MKLKKSILFILALTIFTTLLIGCIKKQGGDKEGSTATSKEYNDNGYLVSIDWLEKNKDNNVVILDGRSKKDYDKGHIPGAINVPWQDLANIKGKAGDIGWGIALDKENLSRKLGELGIDENTIVVTYAKKENGWGEDGRLAWQLKNAGINTKMLNGGFDLWQAQGKEISKDVPTINSKILDINKIDESKTITTEELKKNLSEYKIIDSRTNKEYGGATKFGEAVGGHIKGAISFPFDQVYNKDGTVKSEEELIKIFENAGINKNDNIVIYCTAGIRSAYLTEILKMLGYPNVRNYDASYYEWATTNSDLIEK
ncbi:sulfurtransferase [Clostridium tarantellae]|uniref:thiosulfate sulfurtransferase n=1 Tax=Clostridium tarantellae TaxID=39493 RepID=A0A6I1MHW3_9CLOT|nr:sulfurtransferase [Clostridium tarantellae]MPQ42730.1 sulfurtransferase [Clostridium tarantellae]